MTKGSCMCGAIGYEYTGEPQTTALCHCIDCQKWSGAAYTSNVVIPRKDFKVTKGHPKNWAAVGDSGKKNDHFFCGDCGSSLYTEIEVMPDVMCVKSGSIDDKHAKDFEVQVEFYTKDRLGYCAEQKGAKQVEVFG